MSFRYQESRQQILVFSILFFVRELSTYTLHESIGVSFRGLKFYALGNSLEYKN